MWILLKDQNENHLDTGNENLLLELDYLGQQVCPRDKDRQR